MRKGPPRRSAREGVPVDERTALFRALDANANRAREGLRVAEDVARFVWNDAALTRRVKRVRHGVTESEKRLFRDAEARLAARDVAGDRGRVTREGSEKIRRGAADVFRANLKRAQEALRSLEEFAKVLGSPEAEKFKRLRYEAYQADRHSDKRFV